MILFVDDEPRIMDSYRLFLEDKLKEIGKELNFFSNVDETVAFFKANLSEIELVILDVMMPGGKAFSFNQSNGGLTTGFLLYQKIRKDLPDIPVFIFTNSIDEDIENAVKKDENAKFLRKTDYLLNAFWDKVKDSLV